MEIKGLIILVIVTAAQMASAQDSPCKKTLTDMEVFEIVEKTREKHKNLPSVDLINRERKIRESFCHYIYTEYATEGSKNFDKPIVAVISKSGVVVDYIQGRSTKSLLECQDRNASILDLKNDLRSAREIFLDISTAQPGATFEKTKMRCFDVLSEIGNKKVAYIFDWNGDLYSVEQIR